MVYAHGAYVKSPLSSEPTLLPLAIERQARALPNKPSSAGRTLAWQKLAHDGELERDIPQVLALTTSRRVKQERKWQA